MNMNYPSPTFAQHAERIQRVNFLDVIAAMRCARQGMAYSATRIAYVILAKVERDVRFSKLATLANKI